MSYYDELGVSDTANAEEIRAAFRRKAKGLHPDKPGGDSEKMTRANRAYETLISPERRLTYDRTGQDRDPPLDKLAQEIVLKNVLEWLASDQNSGNLIADVSGRLTSEQQQLQKQITEGGNLIARLNQRLSKLKYRGPGQDLLRLSVNHRITEMKQQVEKTRDQSARLDRAKELLLSYEYEMDTPVWTTVFVTS